MSDYIKLFIKTQWAVLKKEYKNTHFIWGKTLYVSIALLGLPVYLFNFINGLKHTVKKLNITFYDPSTNTNTTCITIDGNSDDDGGGENDINEVEAIANYLYRN